jgi:outer membrane protein assembly factor BamB
MNVRKTAAILAVAIVTVIGVMGCPKQPPTDPVVTGPDTVYQGVSSAFKASSTCKQDIRYVFDWGDNVIDSTNASGSGTEVSRSHAWALPGNYDIKVKALNAADLTKESEWSDPKAVTVLPNSAPVIDSFRFGDKLVGEQGYTSKGSIVEVKAWAHDPDGDSIRFNITWKTSKKDSSPAWLATPARDSFTYDGFDDIDTVWVYIEAKDKKTAVSPRESLELVIGEAGGVVWYWWNEEQAPMTTAPVVVFDGTDSVVISACEDDYLLYSIKINSRRFGTQKRTQKTDHTGTEDEYAWNGHPAYCNQTGHIIVSSEEGEIYGVRADGLNKDWNWPDSSYETITEFEYGPAAISGNKFYLACDEEQAMFRFDDVGSGVTIPVIYRLTVSPIDAPVIDAAGNCIFAADSGYLYSLNAALTTLNWRISLQSSGEIYGPVIGSGGYIFCGGDQAKLYKVDPTTQTFTSVALTGVGKRPAVGPDKVFVGTDQNVLYALDFNLNIVWQKTLSDQVSTTPIVATGGILYVQDESDRLYCLDQATGNQLWVCNMPDVLPGSFRSVGRQMGLNDEISPSPTIAGNGNIICVGAEGMYCVKGYPDKGLDGTAPWPKWQKNHHNAGK